MPSRTKIPDLACEILCLVVQFDIWPTAALLDQRLPERYDPEYGHRVVSDDAILLVEFLTIRNHQRATNLYVGFIQLPPDLLDVRGCLPQRPF